MGFKFKYADELPNEEKIKGIQKAIDEEEIEYAEEKLKNDSSKSEW